MATSSIASLVVSLEANIAKFSTDMQQASQVTTQTMQKIQSGADLAAKALGALGVAFSAGAALNWAKGVTEAAASLEHLHQATGSSVESLSRYINQAKVAGISADEAGTLIYRMAAAIGGAGQGAAKAQEALALLGVTARDPATALQDVAKALDQYADGSNKAALTMAIFRRSGVDFNAMLHDMASGMQVAATVTAQQARAAEDLEKGIRLLALSFNGLKDALLSSVVPGLATMVTLFNAGRSAGLGWMDMLTLVGAGTSPLADSLARWNEQLAKATDPDMIAKLQKLSSVLSGVLQQQRTAALASTVNSLGYIGDARDAAAGNSNSALGGVIKQDAPSLAAATKAIKEQKQAIADYTSELDSLTLAASKTQRAIDLLTGVAVESDVAWNHLDAMVLKINADEAAGKAQKQEVIDQLLDQAAAQDELEAKLRGYTAALKEQQAQEKAFVDARENYTKAQERMAEKIAEASKKAAEEAQRQWERTADSIASSLTDALMRGFESGKSIAQNFIDVLKNWFKTLVLEPIIKFGVQGAMSAIGLGSGMANASGGGSSGISGIGSLLPSLFGMDSLGTGAFMSGMASPIGTLTTLLGGSGGATVGAGLGLEAGLGAAVPIVGGLLAIGTLLSGLIKSGGGPKTGGFATSGGLAGLNVDADNSRYYTPNQMDPAMQKTVDAIKGSYTAAIKALGGTAGNVIFGLGYDTDPKGTAGNRVSAGASINGRSVYNVRNLGVGSSDAEVQAALTTQSQRALLAALQASDLPKNIAKILNSVPATSGTDEAIQAIISLAQAWGGLEQIVTNQSLEDILKAVGDAAAGSFVAFTNMASGMRDVIENFDGSTQSLTDLTAATTAYKNAQIQLITQLEAVRSYIDSMFGDTARNLKLQTLDPAEQYAFYTSEISSLYAQLGSTTDPAAIQKLGDKINADIGAAFGLLDPATQKARLPEFLNNIDAITSAVNERLTAIETDVHQTVSDVLSEVSVKLDAAADKFVTASENNLAASETPIDLNVTVTPPGSAEVTGGGP